MSNGCSIGKSASVILVAVALPLLSLGVMAAPPSGTAWTILVYAAGDTADGVETMCLHDLQELQSASHNKVKTVVMIDRTSNWETGRKNSNARYYDVGYGSMTLKKDCGELNTGVPTSVSDFVVWGLKYAPAQHYALVFDDHGAGWRGVCKDSSSGDDWLTMIELKTALSTIKAKTGVTFDIIAFDACIMSQVEVAYQIKPFAKVMVASQEWGVGYTADVPGYPPAGSGGFPYDMVVNHLSASPTIDALSFATIIVNDYGTFWDTYPHDIVPVMTLSAMDLQIMGGFSNLVYAIQEFGLGLDERIPVYEDPIWICRDIAYEFGAPRLDGQIDLYHFVDLVDSYDMAEDTTLFKAMASIRISIEQMTIAEWHTSSGGPNIHGLSIFFPWTYYVYADQQSTYSSLDFCQPGVAQNWDNFIRDLVNVPA